jgi:hypothetical protein
MTMKRFFLKIILWLFKILSVLGLAPLGAYLIHAVLNLFTMAITGHYLRPMLGIPGEQLRAIIIAGCLLYLFFGSLANLMDRSG